MTFNEQIDGNVYFAGPETRCQTQRAKQLRNTDFTYGVSKSMKIK